MAIFVITMRGYFVVAPSSSKSTLFVLNPILIVGVLYGKIYDGRKLRFFFANTIIPEFRYSFLGISCS